jgi:MFS family permease
MHVVGMYAFSPVAGRLGNRLGVIPVIVAGQFLLAAAAITAAVSPPANGTLLAAPLFLLGLGWSCSFVGGSTLLTRDLAYVARARLQGTADSLTWGSAAAASLGSGLVLSAVGYPALCLIGAVSCSIPLVFIAGRRTRLAEA